MSVQYDELIEAIGDVELRLDRLEKGDRHARLYDAAARIAAGLVADTPEGHEPYRGTEAQEEAVAITSVDLALRLERRLQERISEDT